MKAGDLKGMLFTAGAVALGMIVASMVQTKLLNKAGATPSASEEEE